MIRYIHGPFKTQRLRDLAIARLKRGEECGCPTCERRGRTITKMPPDWCKVSIPNWPQSSGRQQGSWWIGAKVGEGWVDA